MLKEKMLCDEIDMNLNLFNWSVVLNCNRNNSRNLNEKKRLGGQIVLCFVVFAQGVQV